MNHVYKKIKNIIADATERLKAKKQTLLLSEYAHAKTNANGRKVDWRLRQNNIEKVLDFPFSSLARSTRVNKICFCFSFSLPLSLSLDPFKQNRRRRRKIELKIWLDWRPIIDPMDTQDSSNHFNLIKLCLLLNFISIKEIDFWNDNFQFE